LLGLPIVRSTRRLCGRQQLWCYY